MDILSDHFYFFRVKMLGVEMGQDREVTGLKKEKE